MQIREVMSRTVILASPRQTIGEVAQMMAARDIGLMPVGDGDRIVGMVTDRDIVVRGLAAGKGPDTPVSDVMTGTSNTASRTRTSTASSSTWARTRCAVFRS